MATLYEGLKYYREYLFWKTYNLLEYRPVAVNAKPEENQNAPTVQWVDAFIFYIFFYERRKMFRTELDQKFSKKLFTNPNKKLMKKIGKVLLHINILWLSLMSNHKPFNLHLQLCWRSYTQATVSFTNLVLGIFVACTLVEGLLLLPIVTNWQISNLPRNNSSLSDSMLTFPLCFEIR